ncbi:MAG: hypothetical protein GY711_09495 [bacterium]|nr:hypothetical protein [bacterium]
MQVSGVVVYLERDPERARAALRGLAAEPTVDVGSARDPYRVPAVLEAATAGDSKKAVRRLEVLAGVERVEVAFVAFDDNGTDSQKQVAGSREPQAHRK